MIDELTMTLIVIGLTLILLVLVFNHWQAKKIRAAKKNELEKSRAEFQDEILKDDPPAPTSSSESVDSSAFEDENIQTDLEESSPSNIPLESEGEAHLSDEQGSPVADSAEEQTKPSFPDTVDPSIDLIVLFEVSSVSSAANLNPPALSKGLQILALKEDGSWIPVNDLAPNTKIQQLLIALQMVNRDGAMTATDLERFKDWIDTLESTLVCQAKWTSPSNPVEYAIQLDQFCISVDKTLHFQLKHGQGGRFTGTKFRGLVESSGLVLDNGVFVYFAENQLAGYCIENMEMNPFNSDMLRSVVLKGITFKLDIPRCFKCSEVFNHMLMTAQKMETALAAELVDEGQRLLSEAQLEKIRQQVKLIQTNMTSRGIPAGSNTALRLFS